ncbi:hypothetical protein K443DRAFT_135392 [Laccaria amethystina LaAM-08-1]|uniref:Uncharacterized protein n=1 Tax=Laccaria amethystina LaAM-08-1 TaxID=1095629 RepID=A0A0C9WNH7_9AGAR|nr:hypothetical protein K443DRAFT_135392 [Laccaria amethystina LaAM-08-1]
MDEYSSEQDNLKKSVDEKTRGMTIMEKRFYHMKIYGPPPPFSELPHPGFFCLESFRNRDIWSSLHLTYPEEFIRARIRTYMVKTWKGIQVLIKSPRELAGEWVEGFWCNVESEGDIYRLGDKLMGGNFMMDSIMFQKMMNGEWKKPPPQESVVALICWQGDEELLE